MVRRTKIAHIRPQICHKSQIAHSLRHNRLPRSQCIRPFAHEWLDQHRWYYFPDMKMDENIILRTYDSSEENLAPCHCAFEDESTIKFAKPRRSCEARVILVFKKKQEHRNAKL